MGTYLGQTGVVADETMTWLQMPGVTAGLIAFHFGCLQTEGTKVGKGQILKTLETGIYLLQFGDMSGFETPEPPATTIIGGSSHTITAIYGPLTQHFGVGSQKDD